MKSVPITAYQETLGMVYFARMLSKIRKHAAGDLREDFHNNLGKGFDGRCTQFLGVNYEELAAETLKGGTDEELLEWAYAHGRRLTENDLWIWNLYITKAGWKDSSTALLEQRKKESGLEGRDEIQTMLEYFEYDEGRKS